MKRMLFIMIAVFAMMPMKGLCVYASESDETVEMQEKSMTELKQIMITIKETDMKEEPNQNAKTLMTYEAGAAVFVIELVGEDWVMVRFQDKIGYVDKTALEIQKIDTAGIDEELAMEAEKTELVMEEIERHHQNTKNSVLWGTIIVVLIIGIFAMGILSSAQAGKNEEGEDKNV